MENDEYGMHYFANFLALKNWNILKKNTRNVSKWIIKKKYDNNGKVVTSYLIMTMIIRWIANISSRSPKLKCVSWKLTTSNTHSRQNIYNKHLNNHMCSTPVGNSASSWSKEGAACLKHKTTLRPLCILPMARILGYAVSVKINPS